MANPVTVSVKKTASPTTGGAKPNSKVGNVMLVEEACVTMTLMILPELFCTTAFV